MTKKNLTLAELISQAISIALLFIPGMYYLEHWEASWPGHVLSMQYSTSFLIAAGKHCPILCVLVFLVMLFNLALLVTDVFKDIPEKLKKLYTILPILAVALIALSSIIASIMDSYGYCASANWLLAIELFFMVTAVFLSFMRISKNVKEEPRKVKVVTAVPMSNADEIA